MMFGSPESPKHSFFWRLASVLVAALCLITLIVVVVGKMEWRGALSVLVGAACMIVVVVIASAVTEHILRSDLDEIASAMERLAVDPTIDRMPIPRLTELEGLSRQMDRINELLQKNYSELLNDRNSLRAVLDSVNVGVIVTDEELKVDLINPFAVSILGTDMEFALGRTFTEIHHTPVIDRAIEEASEGAAVVREVLISLPSPKSLRVLANPIADPEEGISGVICVLEDVTDRVRLERIRQDFVANVSHELRTPVAGMRAVVSALAAGATEEPELAKAFIRDLDRESTRLADIIEDLLVLSRLDATQEDPLLEEFNLVAIIETVIFERSSIAEQRGVHLLTDFKEEEVPLSAERKLVRLAILNLVDNAIKYNLKDGTVTVSAEQRGGAVTIKVADTGIGISHRELEKIFERFYRVDKGRSRETGGTGLGLSIVRHIADFHGGRVDVSSSEGEGSVFMLTFPVGNRNRSS